MAAAVEEEDFRTAMVGGFLRERGQLLQRRLMMPT